MTRFSTRQIAVTGLLGALTIAMGLLPIGFIPVPTAAGSATTMHIPTIIAGILEGPVVGGLVGLIFGIFSFTRATSPIFKDPLIVFVPRIMIGVVAHYAFQLATGAASRKIATGMVGLTAGYTTYSAMNYVNTLQAKALESGVAPHWVVARLSPLTVSPVFNVGSGVIVGGLLALGTYRMLKHESAGSALASLLGTATNTVGVLGFAVMRGYLTASIAIGVAILHGLPEMLAATVLVVPIYRGLSRTNIIKRGQEGVGRKCSWQ